MPFLNYKGTKMYFRKLGKKSELPPLIFIHGVLANHLAWYSQIKFFLKTTELYLLDLPGHGKSPKPTVEDLPQLCKNLIKQFIIKEKIENPILIGHSLGGGIAQLAVIEYPELIKKVILICTSTNLGIKLRIPRPMKIVIQKILSHFSWPVFCTINGKFTEKHEIPGLEGVKLEARMAASCSGETFLNIIWYLLKLDLSEAITSVRTPMLLITGTKDIFFNQAGFYRNMPHVEVKVIPDGEHILQLLNQETNHFILDFIKS